MRLADTPGKRLRYFADICFESITEFAHTLGYKEPSTVYEYFHDKKEPGPRFFNRIYTVGCNPGWVQSGRGCMFADNETGRALQAFTAQTIQLPGTGPDPVSGSTDRYSEDLYLLISLMSYRISMAPQIAPGPLLIYRDMLLHAQRQLESKARH